MSKLTDTGIGFDEVEETVDEKTVSFDEVKKHKQPWFTWNVCGTEYRLKLTASAIIKLEKKYKCNVMDLFQQGIPELSIMLTIVQAAMDKYHHGISIDKIIDLYEAWVEDEGGSQMDMLQKVMIPTLAVSGFFTPKQAQELLDDIPM